jgi:uncharacterized protein
MTESTRQASVARPVDLHDVDLFEFARAGRQALGQVSLAQLPRMLNEVSPDAPEPERDATHPAFSWQAEGSQQMELQDDGTQGPQAYLRLALHGAAWLECQRCLAACRQAFDIDVTYRIVRTEEEADAFPLDDDELDVIVGSRHFDLLDLIEEELLLALPLVPKHDVCPAVHESLVSGTDGSVGADDVPSAGLM